MINLRVIGILEVVQNVKIKDFVRKVGNPFKILEIIEDNEKNRVETF